MAICFAPSILGCSGKSEINFQNLLGQPVALLSSSYFIFDESGFINSPYMATKAFVFYKKSEIIGFTLIIEGINEINKLTKEISSINGKHNLNYENDFGKEYEWNTSEKNIKLSYNDYKGLPELSFYSEFLKKETLRR